MSSPSRQDRLEDTLTDAVFSALRYLPRAVLGAWLLRVLPERFHALIGEADLDGAVFEFWTKLPGGAEPDLMIRIGAMLVVVEAKYWSGFSTGSGRHQLTIEWAQSCAVARAGALEGPVLIAVTADLVEPADIAVARSELTADAGLEGTGMETEEAVVWCPWQSIAETIDCTDRDGWHAGDEAVVSDVFDLMRNRGVRFVFEGFDQADWWVLGAAAAAANERVYPAIAEFARGVTAQGESQGLVWGGTDSGVVWYESKHLSNTHKWHRNYVQLRV